jgi:S-DNA-T family DNA segregation ATPase FtsK/SpoIIIE
MPEQSTSKANRVLGAMLAAGAIYLLASLALSSSGGGAELPLALTGPGLALGGAFSWAAFFVPLWLGVAAIMAFVPGFHPAAIFSLIASWLPFLAVAAYARFVQDPARWYSDYPALEAIGPGALGLAICLFVIFCSLLIARIALALSAGRRDERLLEPPAFRNVPAREPLRLIGAPRTEASRPEPLKADSADSLADPASSVGQFSFEVPDLPPLPPLRCLDPEGRRADCAATVVSTAKVATAETSAGMVEPDARPAAGASPALLRVASEAPVAPEEPPASDSGPIPLFFGHNSARLAGNAPASGAGKAQGPGKAGQAERADCATEVEELDEEASESLEEAEAGSEGDPDQRNGEKLVELRDGSTVAFTSVPSAQGGGAREPAPGSPEAKAAALARVLALRAAKKPYSVPIEGILSSYPDGQYWIIDEKTRHSAEILRDTLAEFGIKAEVTGIRKGPVITMFEILPAPGVRLSKIANLSDNIALRLAASSVRIVAPIPGKHAVGIEVPNERRSIVSLRELVDNEAFKTAKMEVPVILGKDIAGEAQFIDLVQTPHLLIAGATGSGKSVCVNSIILSILFTRSPEQVKLILIDPKIVELKLYNDIGHLLTPVITEPKRAFQALQYCICEMERRYSMLDRVGVRDIKSYNRKVKDKGLAQERLPYIVVIIDEFADLMATTGKELESTLARLAAMSRAVGIHLVLATQRPSIDVITGLIKANIPSRIAFMVASKFDSRIIIDAVGAEKLLGRGDMLFASAWDPFPIRMQGAFVSEEEVEKAVEYVKGLGEPEYIDDEIFIDDDEDEDEGPSLFDDSDSDPLFDQALEIVLQQGKASASYIQRKLKIGYNRAARLVELMEEKGIVGPAQGSKPRDLVRNPEIAGRASTASRHEAGYGQSSLIGNLETVPGQRVTGRDEPDVDEADGQDDD